MTTFAEHQERESSEKISLSILDASFRAVGWTLYSGSVYSLACSYQVISSLEQDGVALVAAASVVAITAGKYYLDRQAGTLYLQTSDSSNPNSKFLACTVQLFFSNVPVRIPYDLDSGFDVEWLPLIKSTSEFGVEIDNYYQFGLAIEGSGAIKFINDREFWDTRFDKLFFENQKCLIYAWSKSLPATEAKLIYRGRIQRKSWSPDEVSFELKDFLNELRSPIDLPDLSDIAGARIPDSLSECKQRLIYGRPQGVKAINVDQILTGYPLTGTVSLTNGSAIGTGTGTSFLSQLSPNDQVLDSDGVKHTIKTVDSNTQYTLTQIYSGTTGAAKTISVKPSHEKRWLNRIFSIAGHALREPSTTVTFASNATQIEVASAQDLMPGDPVVIESQIAEILRVSGNTIVLTGPLNTIPAVAAEVLRPSVWDVYLNDLLLVLDRDYTYDADTGIITLDSLAEFNVAPQLPITGTLAFTSTSRTVPGTGTFFKKDVKPGDWVRRQGQTDWFEVLSVESDTSLTLRTAATYTSSGAADLKSPDVYSEGKSVLSMSVLGATEDGTPGTALLKTCGEIVLDILDRAGVSDFANTTTFDNCDLENEAILGIVVPSKYNDKNIPSHRDVINLVNKSVFGTLVQNEDFELEYHILSPFRAQSTALSFREVDVIGFSVETNSDKIVKTVKASYLAKEYDPASGVASASSVLATSENGQYLAKSENQFEVETNLVDESAAQIYANRWAFVLGVGTSIVRFKTKLQGARLKATDQIEIEHEKLYQRFASTDRRRVGAVKYSKKNAFDVSIELEDLGNAFSRCATITENDASDFDDSSAEELAYNGFITDTYGMQNNDPATQGRDLIW